VKTPELIERVYVWLTCLVLVGGFGAHQWMLLQGRLPEWTERIGPANVWLGWLLLTVGVWLALGRSADDR